MRSTDALRALALAVLVVAACSKQPKEPDCGAAIAAGVDKSTAVLKSHTVTQMGDNVARMMDRLKAALVKRCTEDKWSAEARACYANAAGMPAMQGCQSKLKPAQVSNLEADLREMVLGGRRMPDSVPGHPQDLTGSGGSSDPGAAPPPPGSASAPGPAGATGAAGTTDTAGTAGAAGSAGAGSAPGSAGAGGAPGSTGAGGAPGSTGAGGAPGSAGAGGAPGSAGAGGAPGSTGAGGGW